MSKRKAENTLEPPAPEKRIKTPTKCCYGCDHSNESPSKLINKVTPSKNLTPSKEAISKNTDDVKTPSKDSLPKKEEKPSLFANLPIFDKQTNVFSGLGNIFNNNNNTINKDNDKGGLFSGITPGGLFGNSKTENEGGGLFGNLLNNTGVLGNNNTGGLFGQPNFLSLNKLTSQDSENDENDNEEGEEGSKSPEINKNESTGNFQYTELYEKIIHKDFQKAKVGDKLSENGVVTIEKAKIEGGNVILVLRNQAKLIMQQGMLMKKLSKIGTINNRNEGLTITIFKQKDGKSSAIEKALCKILFPNEKDCSDFKKELEKYI